MAPQQHRHEQHAAGANIADFAAMNTVYDAWLDTASLPARSTVETRLASPNLRVEMTAIAAAD